MPPNRTINLAQVKARHIADNQSLLFSISHESLRLVIAVLLLSISCKPVTLVLADIGTATSYDPPYAPTKCNGNRADQFPPGNLFVQVSEVLWDNGAACGRRYRLRCLSGGNKPCKGGTVDVRVVDFCSRRPCPSTIVMSNDAFDAVSRYSDAKINIEFIQI
ncbi:EG45-like domain containing protein 2 [Sesamum angolense]|uniref:EG45-like domain containing protein 2 n=1 Tax=Sesamum angolense TaxID=2727404 RepID=A0AAE2BKF3_9LAMI|nr:EG45-like domain containing protein 2 [Sesamum angolense]